MEHAYGLAHVKVVRYPGVEDDHGQIKARRGKRIDQVERDADKSRGRIQ